MAQPTLTPREFAQKWGDSATKERAASQEHFIDLCRMLGEPTPNEADPTGTTYAFEKAVTKAAGGDGFADVWKKDFFGWEYKGKGKDLKAAYLQLLGYREDLSNPPLLVVSDLDTIEIRTNFTEPQPEALHRHARRPGGRRPLRGARDPARRLHRARGAPPAHRAGPDHREGRQPLRRARPEHPGPRPRPRGRRPLPRSDPVLPLRRGRRPPAQEHPPAPVAGLPRQVRRLLAGPRRPVREDERPTAACSAPRRSTGSTAACSTTGDVLPLTGTEITTLLEVSQLNWALIEPAIFGTLFERGLDPEQRAQLGRPLHRPRRHLGPRRARDPAPAPARVRRRCRPRSTELLLSGRKVTKATPPDQNPQAVFRAFLDRLRRVRVLDPACGSGNFLIVCLWALKDLEWEAIQWGSLVLQTPRSSRTSAPRPSSASNSTPTPPSSPA